MGRPRGERQGQRVTIYLTPERLDKLGWDEPASRIYDLIDDMEETDGNTTEEEAQEELRGHDAG